MSDSVDDGTGREAADPRAHHRYRRQMTIRFLYREATDTFRQRFWKVWGVAAAIAVTASLLDTTLDWLVDGYDDDVPTALAAYHAGPGNVDGWRRRGIGIQFPETRTYVKRVLDAEKVYADAYGDELSGG